jgi:general secretion pathway protein B
MACTAIVTVLATYLVMGGFSGHHEAAPILPGEAQQAAAVPQATIPAPPSIVSASHVQANPAPGKPVRTASPQPVTQAPLSRQPASPETPSLRSTPPTTEKPATPPPADAPALPELRVTGIAWQKESADSLAMINGRAIAEGGTVDGAKVVKIFPERVRFSIGDRSFEVPLGKSSQDSQ